MADSAADVKSDQNPDTGQIVDGDIQEEECPRSPSSGEQNSSSNGVTSSNSPRGQNIKTTPFQAVKPAKFVPGVSMVGNNPFAARPSLRTDVVSSSASIFDTSTGSVCSPSKFVLRPSALSAHVHNLSQKDEVNIPDSSIPSLLKPAKLPDPTKSTLKSEQEDLYEKSEKENQRDSPVKEKVKEQSSESPIKESKPPEPENLFAAAIKEQERVPDSSSSPKEKESSSNTSNGAPILGQNLTEKVTGVHTSPNGAVSSTGFVFGENLAERVLQDSALAVAAAAAAATPIKGEDGSQSPDSTEQTALERAQTLEESAREYQALHGKRTELQEIEVLTGEEDESNVLQANGKLFIFDGTQQSWIERGRGLARLNDMRDYDSSSFQSRLVMRTHGSLRVILNTKIWPGMTVERASQKSVRLTATDGDDGVKIFLLMTNPKDNENLLRALDWRIQQRRVQEEKDKENSMKTDKRKAEPESPIEEFEPKKAKKTDDDSSVGCRREESDSSVLDPETEASSESHASSFTLRTDSD